MKKFLMLIPLLFCILACNVPVKNPKSKKNNETGGTAENPNTVSVNFFNESSFKVAVYMNVNPSALDTSTGPIVTVSSGAVEQVQLPPSADQTIGDVFYIRYFVQVADAFTSGTGEPLYVQAKRDISNIAFVLKKGESYTKTISQPAAGQLTFIHCYIKVQNTGSKSFQVLQGSTYLKKLGSAELNLASGKFGFYELNISDLETSEMMQSLKFFVTDTAAEIKAEPFLLERGKVYSFQCDGTSLSAPSVTDITY